MVRSGDYFNDLRFEEAKKVESSEGLVGLVLEGSGLEGSLGLSAAGSSVEPPVRERPQTSKKRVTISAGNESARDARREMKSATGFPNAMRVMDDIPKRKQQ
jgi:hypothetical protein